MVVSIGQKHLQLNVICGTATHILHGAKDTLYSPAFDGLIIYVFQVPALPAASGRESLTFCVQFSSTAIITFAKRQT